MNSAKSLICSISFNLHENEKERNFSKYFYFYRISVSKEKGKLFRGLATPENIIIASFHSTLELCSMWFIKFSIMDYYMNYTPVFINLVLILKTV